jgi:hypothetical protein
MNSAPNPQHIHTRTTLPTSKSPVKILEKTGSIPPPSPSLTYPHTHTLPIPQSSVKILESARDPVPPTNPLPTNTPTQPHPPHRKKLRENTRRDRVPAPPFPTNAHAHPPHLKKLCENTRGVVGQLVELPKYTRHFGLSAGLERRDEGGGVGGGERG